MIIVSDEIRAIFAYITYVGICSSVSLFGVAGNIINLIVYRRQGLGENVNLSLFAMSLNDLFVLILYLYAGICLAPYFAKFSDAAAFVSELHMVFGGSQRMMAVRVSVWIMALVAMERFVSIRMPLKVKMIFTPRRTVVFIIIVSLVLIASSVPLYVSVRAGPKFFPKANKTRLSLIKSKLSADVSVLTAFILQVISLVAIVGSNSLLIVAVRRRTRSWNTPGTFSASHGAASNNASVNGEKGSAQNGHKDVHSTDSVSDVTSQAEKGGNSKVKKAPSTTGEKIATQNRQLAKMTLILSALQLITFVPSLVQFGMVIINPQFGQAGRYGNYSKIIWGVVGVVEVFNASLNIVVYYHMSTRYRTTFQKLVAGFFKIDSSVSRHAPN